MLASVKGRDRRGAELWRGMGGVALDLLFPPRCPSCRAPVAADGNFCAPCFDTLHLITAPMCECCGIPFPVAAGEDMRCPACLEAPPAFDAARAAMVYDRVSAPLIAALKFQDQWAGLARYAQMMAGSGAALLAECDLIVPVPLHWRRLLKRKYNQAALLAYALAEGAGKPCRLDLLRRAVPTKPQMRLDRKSRLTNVRHAFALSALAPAQLKGKRVLLVDDVVTTGATVDVCAKLLRQGGAARVSVLALARTVKE
ncbi:MAG: ComF family protein [Alphaproteobacteria bacterium]